MFDISYNGMTGRDIGVAVTTRPSVPTPEMRGEFVEVAGRDGALLISDGTYENIEIECELNFVRADRWLGNSYRLLKNWISGSGELSLSDDPEVFYKVKTASITDAKRRGKRGIDAVATFVCDPFTYYYSGTTPHTIEQASLNPYYKAFPRYEITGEGNCTLTVNGNKITANVGQNLTIDTDRLLAYRQDGTLMNTSVTGDFDGLALIHGQNTIFITNGFSVTIYPNWRSL